MVAGPSQDTFKEAMSRFPSGVTIVTAIDGSNPVGITVSAFSSVSLEPPLVLVCIGIKARDFEAFQRVEAIGISILGTDQSDVALAFAKLGSKKFESTRLDVGPQTGVPLISGAVAQLECRTRDRIEAGDHVVIVAEAISVACAAEGGGGLTYCDRQFGHVAPLQKQN